MASNSLELINFIEMFFRWLWGHPLAFFTGLSAFFISYWSSIHDGLKKWRSFLDSWVCVLITLAIVAVMHYGGVHSSWMPIIGVFVGFIGAERIREAILGAWETRKSKILDGTDKDGK